MRTLMISTLALLVACSGANNQGESSTTPDEGETADDEGSDAVEVPAIALQTLTVRARNRSGTPAPGGTPAGRGPSGEFRLRFDGGRVHAVQLFTADPLEESRELSAAESREIIEFLLERRSALRLPEGLGVAQGAFLQRRIVTEGDECWARPDLMRQGNCEFLPSPVDDAEDYQDAWNEIIDRVVEVVNTAFQIETTPAQ